MCYESVVGKAERNIIAITAVALLLLGAVFIGQWLASPDAAALRQCRAAIRGQLTAPTTARFHDGYAHAGFVYWTVDAQNALGATLTRQFSCEERAGRWTVQ